LTFKCQIALGSAPSILIGADVLPDMITAPVKHARREEDGRSVPAGAEPRSYCGNRWRPERGSDARLLAAP